jgi:hypothetical protein
MAATNYARDKILNYNFGSIAYTVPASFFLGLSTTTINAGGSTATEPVGAGYARVEIANDKTNWTYSSSGCLLNATSLSFVQSSGSWGTATYLGLWDTVTSGSLWFYQQLPTSKIIQTDTVIIFSASSVAISLT